MVEIVLITNLLFVKINYVSNEINQSFWDAEYKITKHMKYNVWWKLVNTCKLLTKVQRNILKPFPHLSKLQRVQTYVLLILHIQHECNLNKTTSLRKITNTE